MSRGVDATAAEKGAGTGDPHAVAVPSPARSQDSGRETPWELLSLLLEGGGAGASSPHAAWPPALPAPPAPPAPPAGEPRREAAGRLRCLDPAHSATRACRCVPAPADDAEAAAVRLSSGRHGESGEKRLRRLLLATPEWGNEATRHATADSLAAGGDAALADIVRAGRCAALRKGSMILLCRAWGYACDVFRPVEPAAEPRQRPPRGVQRADDGGERRSKRRRGGGSTEGSPAREFEHDSAALLPPLSLRGALAALQGDPLAGTFLASRASVTASPLCGLQALRACIANAVIPLLNQGLRSHAGPSTVAALAMDPLGLLRHQMHDRLVDNELCIGLVERDVERRVRRVAAARAAAVATAGLGTGPHPVPWNAFTPAWAALRGADVPLLEPLRQVSSVVGRGMTLQEQLQETLAVAGGPAVPMSTAQRAWFDDLSAASGAALHAFAHLEAAAGTLQLAPWPEYLQAVVLAEEVLLQWSSHMLRSLRMRREWMLSAAAAVGVFAAPPAAPPAAMQGLHELVNSMPNE